MYQLAARLSEHLISHFLAVWTTLLLAVLAVTIAAATPMEAGPVAASASASPRTRSAWLLQLGFVSFVLLYSLWIVWDVDFAGFDASILTTFSVRGLNHPWPIWTDQGRFFPLCHQEFNLLRHWTRSALGYHGFAVVEMLASLAILDRVQEGTSLGVRLTTATVLLLSSGWFIAFSGLVFPERNLLLLLPLVILAVRRVEQGGGRAWLAIGITAAQLALYYKEPTFLLIGGFAAIRLLVRWGQGGRSRGAAAFLRANPLEVGLALLALGFVGYYAAVMLPDRSLGYAAAHARDLTIGGAFLRYLWSDWLLALFLLALLARCLGLARRREPIDPFWEPLAFGGLFYALVYPVLRLVSGYYLAPADLIFALYLAWRAKFALAGGIARRIGVAIVATAIVLYGAAGVYLRAIESKNVVRAWAGLAAAIGSEVGRSGDRPTRLFFPSAKPYWIMEFGAYLDYKGLGTRTWLEAPQEFPQGRCMSYRLVACHSADSAASGALKVVLPNDDAPPSLIAGLADQSTPVYEYHPMFAPTWSLRLLKRATGSQVTAVRPPSSWLHGFLFRTP